MQRTWSVHATLYGLVIFGVLSLAVLVSSRGESRFDPNYSVTVQLPPPRPYSNVALAAPGFAQPTREGNRHAKTNWSFK